MISIQRGLRKDIRLEESSARFLGANFGPLDL